MSAIDSWQRSNLMITDWSGAGSEYALALGKPVIYLDTPPKIMNAEWAELALPSFESGVRPILGRVVGAPEVARLPNLAIEAASGAQAQGQPGLIKSRIIFNVERSTAVAASYLGGLNSTER